MRWAQLTLTEDAPSHLDIAFWLDYFRRSRCQGACLSAGGYIAYYPTKIPLHYRSARLGDSDPFGALVEGCRRLGMAVIARTDPHAVHDDVFQAHPEWIAVDREGRPVRHWAKPDAWVTCALGPYNFEFMTEVHREIVSLYGVDGIFSNRWAGHGICYCAFCRDSFRRATGHDLPQEWDPRDPVCRRYLLWRQDRLLDLCHLWDQAIRSINPRSGFIPNTGGGSMSPLNLRRLADLTGILFIDRQARSGVMPPWAAGKNAKEYHAVMGGKPVGGIFSVGVEERYRWKDSVQSEAELRIWVTDGIAHGLRPWFTKFSAKVRDPRWLPVVEDIYRWHARHERYLRNRRSLARVGLVYSQRTALFYGGAQAQERVEDHLLGMYHALIEARIPFDMVHDEELESAVPDYDALILPNIAALSDAQCDTLRTFVEQGGGLLATHETSLYTEEGGRRDDFGLADLFGCHAYGQVEGPLKNAYALLEHERATVGHALLKGMEHARRVLFGVYRVPVSPGTAAVPPLTFVPPYPDLPMEEVYPRQEHTDIPAVFCHQLGAGRVVYFPWDIDRTFWEVLNVDHGRLLSNAIAWVAGPQPVAVQGPGVLDLAIWEQQGSLTVHLVNLTNPMMMKGPFRDLYPIGPLTVSVQVPEDHRVQAVHLLRADMPARSELDNGFLRVEVPCVLDHEVIAIDVVRP